MKYVTIRYSHMYYRGQFLIKDDLEVKAGDLCIIKSPRGVELGKVLSSIQSFEGDVVWLKNSKTHGELGNQENETLYLSGEVLRIAAEEDIDKMQVCYAKGTSERTAD